MADWREEAKFVLEALKNDYDMMFSNDNSEHSERRRHDEFVAEWGFSYYDMWDLDKAIAMFVLPRIAYYRSHSNGHPGVLDQLADDGCTVLNEEEAEQTWSHILETICAGFHLYLEKDHLEFSKEEKELWITAKRYLFDYFEQLWD